MLLFIVIELAVCNLNDCTHLIMSSTVIDIIDPVLHRYNRFFVSVHNLRFF